MAMLQRPKNISVIFLGHEVYYMGQVCQTVIKSEWNWRGVADRSPRLITYISVNTCSRIKTNQLCIQNVNTLTIRFLEKMHLRNCTSNDSKLKEYCFLINKLSGLNRGKST